MTSRIAMTVLALLGYFAAPASAQDLPDLLGFATAQAPEAGSGVCFDSDAGAAMACAQQACMAESGLGPSDCAVNLWCYPSFWVADIFMQHAEGPHWHQFVCAEPSRESLDALVAFKCAVDYLIECTPVRVWDPQGVEQLAGR
jgi:hypothetical protein